MIVVILWFLLALVPQPALAQQPIKLLAGDDRGHNCPP